ncbi:MAG: ABC transporter substrate-binding protein [Ignavibacteria bacterium]|nr:ABC transporter substrate-binding protein [Ignavibacteria bacterium]
MTLLQNLQQLLNGNKLILFFSILIFQQIFAQQSDFEKGINYFNEGKYAEAIKLLEKFVIKENDHSETANLILVLSFFKLNNFEKASILTQRFITNYPASKSLPVILETQLAIAIKEKNFSEIESALLKLDKFNLSKDQLDEFYGVFTQLLTVLNQNQMEYLENNLRNPLLKFAYHKALLVKSINELNPSSIKKHYSSLIQTGLHSDLLTIRKIGVLIPASQKTAATEKSIIDGLKLAVHKFNNEEENKIEIKIYKGDEKFLEKALIELAKDPEVLCVIGPLYSSQFKNIAILADKLKIPLISPTATAADISIKSKFIFQFNPTLDVRGSAMAKFGIEKLNSSRIGILSCDNSTYKPIVNEIKKKLKSSKAEILIDLNWNENKKSLPAKIKEIRKAAVNRDLVLRFNQLMDFETEQKLIALGLTHEIIDSLKNIEAEVSIFEIFGKDAEKVCKTNKLSYYKRSQSIIDDLNIPVYSLDALLITISNPDLIPEITNELQRQNIITQIIGNDLWNSLDDLLRGYPSTDGVFFTSDYFVDQESKEINDLIFETQSLKISQPNRNFFYGFETMNKILHNWDSNINRENFYDYLIGDRDYEGFSSDIILNQNGVNCSVFILQYKNRKIRKIDRIISN